MTEQQGSRDMAPAVGVRVGLRADVRPDWLQLESDGGHPIATGPAMLTGKVALRPSKLPRNHNSPLARQDPAPLCHRPLGGNGETSRDGIEPDRARDKLTFFLARQRVADGSPGLPTLSLQLPPPSLRDKDYLLLALPAGMRQALIIVFHALRLGLPQQAPPGGLLSH